jgi:hypothetical protein
MLILCEYNLLGFISDQFDYFFSTGDSFTTSIIQRGQAIQTSQHYDLSISDFLGIVVAPNPTSQISISNC